MTGQARSYGPLGTLAAARSSGLRGTIRYSESFPTVSPDSSAAARIESADSTKDTISPPPRRTVTAAPGPDGRDAERVRGPHGLVGLARLPEDHVSFRLRGRTYYRVGFTCYKPRYDGANVFYVEISPPYGAVFPTLPPGCQTVTIAGDTYHCDDRTYYKAEMRDGATRYVVVEPPVGATQRPAGPSLSPIALLQRMSDYLARAQQFSFEATETTDRDLGSGAKARLSARRTLHVSRPDKMFVAVKGDHLDRGIWYDGKTITILNRKRNQYAATGVPGTIDVMLHDIAVRYGVTVPLSDLVCSSAFKTLMTNTKATAARYVGTAKIGEIAYHHVAFEGEQIDWQIWIETGDRPLPRKLLFSYKVQAGHPRYTAMLENWDLSPTLPEKQFAFQAPAGTKPVDMLSVAADRGKTAPKPSP